MIIAAAIQDIRAEEVAQWGGKCVNEPGEGPDGEQCDGEETVELEAQWRADHKLGLWIEVEYAPEPH